MPITAIDCVLDCSDHAAIAPCLDQELATAFIEKMELKILLLNNQHLGMVVQWEDRFYKANRAHTYLGKPEAEWHETGNVEDIYPDFVKVGRAG